MSKNKNKTIDTATRELELALEAFLDACKGATLSDINDVLDGGTGYSGVNYLRRFNLASSLDFVAGLVNKCFD